MTASVLHLIPRFHIITVISNPVRYKSRYRLYKEFIARMPTYANVWTVEVQQGEREFVCTEAGNPFHIQIRTEDEIWIKENMINIAYAKIVATHPDCWGIATLDADISFQRDDWIEETLQQLQNYNVVQMFQTCVDSGPEGETIQVHKGFGWSYVTGQVWGKDYSFWHPGYAWAYCRSALENVGTAIGSPFIAGAILGAADHHMALAMIGRVNMSYPGNISAGYKMMCDTWQDRAEVNIYREVGYVPGTIFHHWHGKKKNRFYVERWEILTKHQFDPYKHLVLGANGLYKLDNSNIQMRDDIKRYFRARNEDSIDLE